MKKKVFRRAIVCMAMVVIMVATSIIPCQAGQMQLRSYNLTDIAVQVIMVSDTVCAASKIKSSKAKSIATKDAKSRYKAKKAYSTKATSSKYKGNPVWVVKFYSKKSGKKYNYIYYISQSSGKILYRKQYMN